MVVEALILITQQGGRYVAPAYVQTSKGSVELHQLAVYEQGGVAIVLVFGQVHFNHIGRCSDHGAGVQRVRRYGNGY